MQKLLLAGAGLLTLFGLYKFEKKEDGALIALSPFLAAVAIVLLSRSSERPRRIDY